MLHHRRGRERERERERESQALHLASSVTYSVTRAHARDDRKESRFRFGSLSLSFGGYWRARVAFSLCAFSRLRLLSRLFLALPRHRRRRRSRRLRLGRLLFPFIFTVEGVSLFVFRGWCVRVQVCAFLFLVERGGG